jgi:hypothetical protein
MRKHTVIVGIILVGAAAAGEITIYPVGVPTAA